MSMQSSPPTAATQQGYSLIEVMVAISVSLFLLSGMVTILQHTRSTFKAQNDLAQLQDSERLAMSLLTDVIQSAGYYPNPHLYSATQTLVVSPSFPNAAAPAIAIAKPAITGALGDTIAVRYAAAQNDNVYNCRGDKNTTVAPFETWENIFSVVAVPGVVPPQYQLQCALWSGSTKTTSAQIPLATGIQKLELTYGLNDHGAGTGTCTDAYKLAADMVAADWGNICSVKVKLTFTNPMNPKNGTQPTIPFSRVVAVMQAAGVNP